MHQNRAGRCNDALTGKLKDVENSLWEAKYCGDAMDVENLKKYGKMLPLTIETLEGDVWDNASTKAMVRVQELHEFTQEK